ncbi:MAG: glycosyltransferase [Candidatus Aenigmarchaeota archaeon]|nr:glycosyltransferase [Candidatus Aenigmarchaeota archaeon]
MKKFPKISLLVPAYNEESVIENTLIHLIKDVKYPKKEIIVGVDDGEDKTLEIARRFTKRYRNVSVIYNKVRLGVTGNMNKLLKRARGDIIIKFDADLKFGNPKTALFNIIKYFRDPEVGGIYYTGEIDWKKNSHPFVEKRYWPEIIEERERSINTRAENFLTVLQVQYRKQFFPVKGIISIPIDIHCFRRGIVKNLDHSIVHDDVEFAYQVLKKGYKIELAKDVFVFCPYGSPVKTKHLLQQKIKGNVGWMQSYKRYAYNIPKYFTGVFFTFIKNFYKTRPKDIISFFYWLAVFKISWLFSFSKRYQKPTKVWKRWKRK